ncbi:hypothetical protein JW964_07545 [candidate division KSB1 bacterium]|nr:hypothetical protein [candidate division KSB1 bacterium]
MLKLIRVKFSIILFVLIVFSSVFSQEKIRPFFQNSTYETGIQSPDQFLQLPAGERPSHYQEVVDYFTYLAQVSSRVKLVEIGETYEHRKLYLLLVTSIKNLSNIEVIRENIKKLTDPRKLSPGDAKSICENSPAIVWMGYGIHGDELSSSDAALQVAFQLAAGTDSLTSRLNNELVHCIVPMINPDGRERYLSQLQQWSGIVPNPDAETITHAGVWPRGRGNHYLFDLNRDWVTLVHPETRACSRMILVWNPQVVIDSHEMASSSTYLFSPPTEPINPNIGQHVKKWWRIFELDQAKAFDQYGWSYYTGAWNDEWYPGFGAAWPLYFDAIGILYEQARSNGATIKRADGTLLTYREGIHHHLVSSLANLQTAASNRKMLLTEFYQAKVDWLASIKKKNSPCFLIVPDAKNPTRALRLIQKLQWLEIEVYMAENAFKVTKARDYWGNSPLNNSLPAGTFVIPLEQPMGRLAKAILEFDPRIVNSFLTEERKSLEKHQGSKLYESTGFSMPIAYHLDCFYLDQQPSVKMVQISELPVLKGIVKNSPPKFGYLIEIKDDRAMNALSWLFNHNFLIRSASAAFEIEGQRYSPGTLLLKNHENPAELNAAMQELAEQTGIQIVGVNTALSKTGPDLGEDLFVSLRLPRIGLVTGEGTDQSNFGAMWHLLDYRMRMRTSLLMLPRLKSVDLTKYNVLILSSTSSPNQYRDALGKSGMEQLKRWVEMGGTLIAIESAAAFLADSSSQFSQVCLKRQILKQLARFETAADQEAKLNQLKIDSLLVWEGTDISIPEINPQKKSPIDYAELVRLDQWQQLFMPRGASLSVDLDETHWLTFGVGAKVPVDLYTSYAYLSRLPVQTVGRFSEINRLRLSGLLWPEAKTRWAMTGYLLREAKGKGQMIFFAGEPTFRGYFHGTERLFLNAVMLGPGFGVKPVNPW